MTQKAQAGWYPDPAGSGGQRYWSGGQWTTQVRQRSAAGTDAAKQAMSELSSLLRSGSGSQTPVGHTSSRIPDGQMMLNGHLVPLGQMSTPAASSRSWSGLLTALVVLGVIGLVAAILFAG